MPKPFEFLVFWLQKVSRKGTKMAPKMGPERAPKRVPKGSPLGVPNLFILFEFGGPLIYSELMLPTPEYPPPALTRFLARFIYSEFPVQLEGGVYSGNQLLHIG